MTSESLGPFGGHTIGRATMVHTRLEAQRSRGPQPAGSFEDGRLQRGQDKADVNQLVGLKQASEFWDMAESDCKHDCCPPGYWRQTPSWTN